MEVLKYITLVLGYIRRATSFYERIQFNQNLFNDTVFGSKKSNDVSFLPSSVQTIEKVTKR